MEVFGRRWDGYMTRIKNNWERLVTDEDTVIIPGDVSWALSLDEAVSDLKFIDSLPGKKILGKGNHDFWWSTASKMYKFFEENGFDTLKILYNNAFVLEDRIICGTRGWFPDESKQVVVGDVDYEKIVNRELTRLRLSLDAAKKLQISEQDKNGRTLPIEVFLHFPPIWADFSMPEMLSLLQEYEIKRIFFGHIHSAYNAPRSFECQNMTFTLTSSDFLNFYPLKI